MIVIVLRAVGPKCVANPVTFIALILKAASAFGFRFIPMLKGRTTAASKRASRRDQLPNPADDRGNGEHGNRRPEEGVLIGV